MFERLRKGIKKFVDKKVQMCKEVLSSDKNLWTLSWVMVGAGLCLMISVYTRVGVPN